MNAPTLRLASATITLPDTNMGLAIDENGTRTEGVSCSAQDRSGRVQMITEDSNDIAIAWLTATECVELGSWLISAGVRFGAKVPTKMTVYRFETVKAYAARSGNCAVCGKPAKRTRVFENTINPYNRNEDGSQRTYAQVRKNVDSLAAKWMARPVAHAGCEART